MTDSCELCGLQYRDLRTDMTYRQVSEGLWQEVLRGERRHKTRATVLGRWYQIKQELWRAHLAQCEHYALGEQL